MRKIFGIGCSRTGTKSLSLALEGFGMVVQHYPDAASMLRGDFDVLKDVDFANDIPVSIFFKELDSFYPGSKFILTVRDKERWLRSCENMFFKEKMIEKYHGTPQDEIFRMMYGGSSFFERENFSRSYDKHYNNVLGYFAGRPEDLLILPVEMDSSEKMKLLSAFTGWNARLDMYPHAHKAL